MVGTGRFCCKSIRIIIFTACLALVFLGALNDATKKIEPSRKISVAVHRSPQLPAEPAPDCLPGWRPDLPCLTQDQIDKASNEPIPEPKGLVRI
jgi:hypothetical protein